jgi:hypothetical protein
VTADLRHFIEGVLLVLAALLPIVNPLGTRRCSWRSPPTSTMPRARCSSANGTAVVLRLSAFILLCIGVHIMSNGADALLGISGPPRVRVP